MVKKPLSPEDIERKKQRRLARREKRKLQKERETAYTDEDRERDSKVAIVKAKELAFPNTPTMKVDTPIGKKTLPAYVPIPDLPPEHYAYFQGLMRIIGYAQRMKFDKFVQVTYRGDIPLPGEGPRLVK